MTTKPPLGPFELEAAETFHYRMHRDGSPGYAPCTRDWPHDGPCAHPLTPPEDPPRDIDRLRARLTERDREFAAEQADGLEARSLLAAAIRARDPSSSSALVDCARRMVELLEQEERIKHSIQADAQRAHEQHVHHASTSTMQLSESYKFMLRQLFDDIAPGVSWALAKRGFAESVGLACSEVRRLKTERGCPCLHTTPCHDHCACLMPLSSSGCRRCCSYGSPEQQKAMAKHLARILDAPDPVPPRDSYVFTDVGSDRVVHDPMMSMATYLPSPTPHMNRIDDMDRHREKDPIIGAALDVLRNTPVSEERRQAILAQDRHYLCEVLGRPVPVVRTCRVCGCTEDDCRGCIARTGAPCGWVQADLCSACAPKELLDE